MELNLRIVPEAGDPTLPTEAREVTGLQGNMIGQLLRHVNNLEWRIEELHLRAGQNFAVTTMGNIRNHLTAKDAA